MDSTSEQLRFASIPGCTVRADFAGGGLSSDLGPLLLSVCLVAIEPLEFSG